MGVQVRGIIAARGTAVRSLGQVIAPKRLSRRMREEGRPFEPALLIPLLVIVLASVAAFFTPHLQFYRLLGATPALAAAMFSVAGTLGIGLLALIAGFAITAADHNLGQTPGNCISVRRHLWSLMGTTGVRAEGSHDAGNSRARKARWPTAPGPGAGLGADGHCGWSAERGEEGVECLGLGGLVRVRSA
ncbi:hypothetical protein [Streptomyces sp. NPDC002619]|uniref:hypothetical protein n=1 Tax=Streptomyces sp. NPDC002619 TaxID=3364655 RepID=UPI0036C270F7